MFFVQHFPITVHKTNSGALLLVLVGFFFLQIPVSAILHLCFCLKRGRVSVFHVLESLMSVICMDLLHDGDFGDGVGREIQNCRVNQYQASNVGRIPFQRVELNVCALCF